ncbi:Maf family protein [Humisphaera borealis]|uniref:dTTP/UTP pyrophosphatase n=1 Tax=Humisphaera borealis TaxID=2807512 RepID=A0A7M2WUN0_9BACT|nr:Maf family protein [Humisphaera borealis]QOV88511.1 septum formation protein Maf [Humisphaera borealis]
MARLILASGSPRRLELLREAGYAFDVHPADVDESDFPPSLSPAEIAELLANRKADTVARRFPDDLVLAADTVVALGNQMLGKPADADDARRILRSLSGTLHQVITAVVLCRASTGTRLSKTVRSSVSMREMTDQELEAYIATGLWEGKAGAYGIQDNDPFVTRIDGSLTNIVGLPMEQTRAMLSDCGYEPAR